MAAAEMVKCPKCEQWMTRDQNLRPKIFHVGNFTILACPPCQTAFAAVPRER
jgi:hypothetical protein